MPWSKNSFIAIRHVGRIKSRDLLSFSSLSGALSSFCVSTKLYLLMREGFNISNNPANMMAVFMTSVHTKRCLLGMKNKFTMMLPHIAGISMFVFKSSFILPVKGFMRYFTRKDDHQKHTIRDKSTRIRNNRSPNLWGYVIPIKSVTRLIFQRWNRWPVIKFPPILAKLHTNIQNKKRCICVLSVLHCVNKSKDTVNKSTRATMELPKITITLSSDAQISAETAVFTASKSIVDV